ncbi:MAG: hypothetical protein KBT03_13825 [Bacteroidales bacterium]|nr:hypothetical protein [Candidatus Scybalousia scybalohippi]
MEIKGKIHCFFEQSGTFKNEFKKLGYDAEDYDIQNNFNETDHVIDLFNEIEKAYIGGVSIFDGISQDDLIIAFFPCIYFESLQMTYYSLECVNNKTKPKTEQIKEAMERLSNRTYFHTLLYKLIYIVEKRKLRLIIENPATAPHYLITLQNFPKPQVVDKNRMERGDYFKKPTAYWFFGCEPTYGQSFQNDKEQKIIKRCKSGYKAGICSEERSLISPDYARNWICDFVLGKKQDIGQLQLF